MPINFIYVVLLYALINLVYSMGLKHIPVLELILVSSGFVLRLVGGGEALSIDLSPWIIVATASLSLLITVAKRRSDLVQKSDPEEQRASLIGYNVEFLNALLSILVSVTIVVYVIFSISDYATERYGRFIIFSSIPVLIGMFRFLQLAIVFERGDFPTELITRDKGIIACILLFVCIFILTTFVGDI
jgi:4-hydroxybenzoate polyprenyltransferase